MHSDVLATKRNAGGDFVSRVHVTPLLVFLKAPKFEKIIKVQPDVDQMITRLFFFHLNLIRPNFVVCRYLFNDTFPRGRECD